MLLVQGSRPATRTVPLCVEREEAGRDDGLEDDRPRPSVLAVESSRPQDTKDSQVMGQGTGSRLCESGTGTNPVVCPAGFFQRLQERADYLPDLAGFGLIGDSD